MPDRKKVIDGLVICLNFIDEQDCPESCPYFDICQEYEGRVMFQPLMRDALALLKEHEPKTGHWIDSAGDDKCSVCGATYSDLYPDYHYTHYCPNCGAEMKGETEVEID